MKKTEIIFNQTIFDQMKSHLLQDDNREYSGFLLAGKVENKNLLRLLAKEFIPVENLEYEKQSGVYIKVKKEFLVKVLRRVEQEKLNLIEIHSHPFAAGQVNFSAIDMAGQKEAFPYVAKKIPEIRHASLVMGKTSLNGHVWNRKYRSIEKINEIRVIGDSLQKISLCGKEDILRNPNQERYARQAIALGEKGQAIISKTKVGIAGVGGIGWNLTLQLAHLGVRDFVLVDRDKIETSNLNRLIGARAKDAGRYKIIALKELLKRINPKISALAINKRIGEEGSFENLKDADILVGCVDNWGTRVLLNSFSVQCLVPYFDAGTEIRVEKGRIVSVATHCLAVIPGFTPCFECLGVIDKAKAAQDLLSHEERKVQIKRGYIRGADVAAPAVLPLNNVILSLMAWEILNYLTCFKKFQPFLHYDGLNDEIKTKNLETKEGCVVCDANSSNFALGDHAPLPRAYFKKAKNIPEGVGP